MLALIGVHVFPYAYLCHLVYCVAIFCWFHLMLHMCYLYIGRVWFYCSCYPRYKFVVSRVLLVSLSLSYDLVFIVHLRLVNLVFDVHACVLHILKREQLRQIQQTSIREKLSNESGTTL